MRSWRARNFQSLYPEFRIPPWVNGRGISQLKEAGLEVESGFMQDAIFKQLEYFICHISKQRPFVIWKSSLSLDGKYAARDGSSRWISNSESRKYVHKLRSEVDVVLTGINTVLIDDPLLNVRLPKILRQPLRAVLDLLWSCLLILNRQQTPPSLKQNF